MIFLYFSTVFCTFGTKFRNIRDIFEEDLLVEKVDTENVIFHVSTVSTIFTHWPISVIGRRGDKSSVSIGTIVAPLKRRIVFCPVSFSPPVPDTNFRGVMFKESSSFANVLCLKFAI